MKLNLRRGDEDGVKAKWLTTQVSDGRNTLQILLNNSKFFELFLYTKEYLSIKMKSLWIIEFMLNKNINEAIDIIIK